MRSPWESPDPAASAEIAAPAASAGGVLDEVRAWLGTYILTLDEIDLDLLTLWAAHTHLVAQTYTTPRLVLDSPVPGSGKTTVLEHLARLCHAPIQAASLSSPALLTRLLDKGTRTVLIDEVDRTLSPKREGVEELIAVINSGYKRGATRPVLVPTKDGWDVAEMPTYAPIALAGNAPDLPDDTRSRCIRVLLMPDLEGRVEPSDWEEIEPDAEALGEALAEWAFTVADEVRTIRPQMPEKCVGRIKERWAPLARVAHVYGGRWPEAVDQLVERDLADAEADREDGVTSVPPHMRLLADLHEVWDGEEPFMPTETILARLIAHSPEQWGAFSPIGKELTAHRLGRMLARNFKINSTRPDSYGPRGYLRTSFLAAWRRTGITPPRRTGGSGGTGRSGDLGGGS